MATQQAQEFFTQLRFAFEQSLLIEVLHERPVERIRDVTRNRVQGLL